MRPMLTAVVLALLVVPACDRDGGGPESAAERLADRLEPCEWSGVDGNAWCGVLEVPEDRSSEDGRRIGLSVAVLPATGDGGPAADAVTFLAGGGVAPATRYLPFFARALPRLREGRDIVLVDQRGTGASNPLACDLPQPHQVEEAGDAAFEAAYLKALERCREETRDRADPAFYTSAHAADDLDAVRDWLGYERLSLWGASYGTKLARVYMRRHPDRVRAAVLHGVVPLSFSMWPGLVPAADSALGALFALCRADEACAAAYPDLETRFEALASRLASRPERLRVPLVHDPADTVVVMFDRRSLSGLVIGMLRSSRAARSLPATLDQLSNGQFDRAAEMQRPGAPMDIPRGVYLSIACSEEFPRLTEADLERARRPTRLGAGEWIDEERRECEIWGSGPVPGGFWEPVASDVPVYLLTGSEDYITPPAYAERVASTLPSASMRVVPQRGHDDLDPCVAALIENFLIQGRDTDPDLGCPEDRAPLPFELPPEPAGSQAQGAASES